MKFELNQKIYDGLKAICMDTKKKKERMSVQQMLMKLMDMEDLLMHCPYHHYLVPAAMLTQVAIAEDKTDEELENWLAVAEERGKTVPAGFCGECGSCGAGVSMGLFVSVYTGATPKTTESWQWANEATGCGLMAIAKYPGPRCCKRTAFLAVEAVVPFINEKCGTNLLLDENVVCSYYNRNAECLEGECPFYKIEAQQQETEHAIIVAAEMMPKPDPKNTCKCMKEPVKLTTKKGTLTWIKNVGDAVKEGELLCEGEVEKKILEFLAPCDGVLTEQCVADGEVFMAGTILGYLKG